MRISRWFRVAAVISLMTGFVPSARPQEKPSGTVEEIIAKHQASVGPAEKLAATKSRVAQGTAKFQVRRGGGGDADGSAVFFSEGRKLRLSLQFNSINYPQDQLAFDGSQTYVGSTGVGTRSHLGDFFTYRPEWLKSGLLGGAFSTAWPLLYKSEALASLKYVGEKKIGNQTLLRVDFQPGEKLPGLSVSLFFEPDSYRHVLTVYRLEVGPGMSASPNITAAQDDSLYTLEESFSDFRAVDGMQLPARWKLRYERNVQRGQNTVMEWDFAIQNVQHNQRIDPKAFIPKPAQSN